MADFQHQMETKGWALFHGVLGEETLRALRAELENAYVKCREHQIRNGMEETMDGTVHHLVCLGHHFLAFLDEMGLDDYLTQYFGGKYILNSYGGVKNLKDKPSYVANIHRDLRSFSGDLPLMINLLVMLDDFTLENGATYFLSGSHRQDAKPQEDAFYERAERAVGQAGSLVLFNSNLWHAAGKNTLEQERRALTLTFTKPFLKQQLDYPRFFGEFMREQVSENVRQLLGYNARIPTNLDEWYQPREKRLYHSDQV